MTITEDNLIEWLLGEIPGLKPYFEKKDSVRTDSWNSYAVFSYVLNPYLKSLLKKEEYQELKSVFISIETLANLDDRSVKNELFVAMEELDEQLHLFWPFMGTKIKANEKERITSYPLLNQNKKPINRTFDNATYLRRWEEKVRKIGGWHKLTTPHLLKIRFELVEEFNIQSMIKIKPGGKEWKEAKLPWPI